MATRRKVIGVITVPLNPNRAYVGVCGDSYISSSYIDWLKGVGLEILPIPYTTTKHKYYFERVNSLYFPGGSVFASNDLAYYKCCKAFFELAMEANDRGDYFPLWGVCLGMQQMMIIVDGKDNMNLLERFDSYNDLKLPLHFTTDGLKGRLMTYLLDHNPDMVKILMDQPLSINNHMMGLSPASFNKNPKLQSFFRIVSYNYDRQGKAFVSTIEAKKYPFYGVQWHPESIAFFYDLANFLWKETSKNQHNKTLPKHMELQHQILNCTRHTGLYKVCHFYWSKAIPKKKRKACQSGNIAIRTD